MAMKKKAKRVVLTVAVAVGGAVTAFEGGEGGEAI